MSTRRTAILAAIFASLALYFFLFERNPVEPEASQRERETKILECPDGGLREARLRGRRGTVDAQRSGDRWVLSSKPALDTPAHLAVEGLAAALCELPVIDTISAPDGFAEFGLEPAAVELEVAADGWQARLRLGSATPAGNLLYARRDDRPEVLKVGVLLASEVEKVLAFAAPDDDS